jgi:hypothetical protein
VIKSGTDFRNLSFIGLSIDKEDRKCVNIEKIEKYFIDTSIEEKPEIKTIVDSYLGKFYLKRKFIFNWIGFYQFYLLLIAFIYKPLLILGY